MKKIQLPAIVPSARLRPLSIDPHDGSFIYYDDVAQGKRKIVPIELLHDTDVQKLAVERERTNEPMVTVLQDKEYTNSDRIREMEGNTEVGKKLISMDINYLKYYLSHFPKEVMK